MNYCEDHKCIKDKVNELTNNRKFWHRIFSSQLFFWGFTGFIAICLAFGVWITTEIFAQQANDKENKAVASEASKDIKGMKEAMQNNVKELKDVLQKTEDKRQEQRDRDQEKLVRMLLDIQKQIRNK